MLFPKPEKKKKKKVNREYKEKALPYCQVCGKTGGIQRHHIIKRSQGGTNNPKHRIDLCVFCHRKADNKEEGYRPKDLYWYKWLDKKRTREIAKLLSP